MLYKTNCAVCGKTFKPSNFLRNAKTVTCGPKCHHTHRMKLQRVRRSILAKLTAKVARRKKQRRKHLAKQFTLPLK